MLSYQHAYHAGCFADVVKHTTLTYLLDYMIQKDKPLLYLETHAGRGLYDLKDAFAQKTKEAAHGVERLWHEPKPNLTVFSSYLKHIKALNPTSELRFYPGSPLLAINTLRAKDRLYLCELHPEEFKHVQKAKHQAKRVHFSQSDGLAQLKALLPPPERRGLIFIDPSYELKIEYQSVPEAIKLAFEHFSTGVYCLWYPLVDAHAHQKLIKYMGQIKAPHHIRFEFYLNHQTNPLDKQWGMNGCGLWILNPPFTLKAQLKALGEALCQLFNPKISNYLLD